MDLIRVSRCLDLLYPMAFVEQEDLDAGTRCHLAMEIAINDRLMGLPSTGHLAHLETDQERARVLAALEWMEQVGFEPEEAEGEYAHKTHGYVGHVDARGIVPQKGKGLRILIDWKFSESVGERQLMQAEAYRNLTGDPVWLVQIPASCKVHVTKCKPRPDLFAPFLCALGVLKFQRSRQGKEMICQPN